MQEFLKSILRLVQLLFVLLTTALMGNVVATNGGNVATAAIHFIMFVCALSWLATLYGLAAHFVSAIAIPIVSLALDGSTTLFSFIGAVVLSAKLTAVNCDSIVRSSPVSIFISYPWRFANANHVSHHCRGREPTTTSHSVPEMTRTDAARSKRVPYSSGSFSPPSSRPFSSSSRNSVRAVVPFVPALACPRSAFRQTMSLEIKTRRSALGPERAIYMILAFQRGEDYCYEEMSCDEF
jgi:hypothetical protein